MRNKEFVRSKTVEWIQAILLYAGMALVTFLGCYWIGYFNKGVKSGAFQTVFESVGGLNHFTLVFWLSAAVIMILAGGMVLLMFRGLKRTAGYLKGRAGFSAVSDASLAVSRWSLSDQFDKYVREFGIEVKEYFSDREQKNPEIKTIDINQDILNNCLPANLARLLARLFSRKWECISPHLSDSSNIFHHLADQLLDAWPEEAVDKFVGSMYDQEIELGHYLGEAVDDRKVAREYLAYKRDMEEKIARLKEARQKQRELRMFEQQKKENSLGRQFVAVNHLVNGGSLLKLWLMRMGLIKPSSQSV
ncbi:MAG: hypothetical protein AAB358_02700 [Patescibacteria group bacterium]